MSAGPELSVVTVTHNRAEKLGQKLAALSAQTLAPERFELCLLLNACTDDTKALLERSRFPFAVNLTVSDTKLSPAQARNRCARQARGRVLYFSDDDCLPEPETLERHLEAQEQACVAVGGLEFVEDGAREVWSPRRVNFWNCSGANTSVGAVAFWRVGGFDETLTGYGGEDVLLGYALKGLPFVALPEALAIHLGPNPLRAGDLAKAKNAGRNAVRIATRYPELAFRLGVHRALLALKRGLLRKNLLGRLMKPAVYDYERAYLRGALEETNRDRS